MRFLRRLLVVIGGIGAFIVLLGFGGYIYVNKTYPPEKIALLLQQVLQEKLNLSVKIDEVHYTWHGRIQIKNIIVYDVLPLKAPVVTAENTKQKLIVPAKTPSPSTSQTSQSPDELLNISTLILQISLKDLVSKKIRVQAIDLENVNLLYSAPIDKKKYRNRWAEIIGRLPPSSPGQQLSLDIEKLSLKKVRIKSKKDSGIVLPDVTSGISVQLSSEESRVQIHLSQAETTGIRAEMQIKPGVVVKDLTDTKTRENFLATVNLSGKIIAEKTSGELLSVIAGSRLPVSVLNGTANFSYAAKKITYTTNQATAIHKSGETIAFSSTGEYDLISRKFFSAESKIHMGSAVLSLTNLLKDAEKPVSFAFKLDGKTDTLARLAGFSGSHSGNISANGKMTGKKPIHLSLLLTDFTNVTKGIETKINSLKAEYDGRTWKVPATEIVTMGSRMNLQVNYRQNSSPPSLQLVLGAAELQLETIAAKLGQLPGSKSSGDNDNLPFNISAALHIGKVKYADFVWHNVQFSVESSSEKIRLSPLSFKFASGNFSGTLERHAGKKYIFDVSFSGFQMNEFLKMLQASGQVRTTCSGNLKGTFTGETSDEIKKTLKADARFSSGKGRISNTFLQQGYLNGPLSPLEDKLSDIEFDKSELFLQANDGNINVTKVLFEAGEWSIRAGGQTDYHLKGEAHTTLKFKETFIENIANPLQLGIGDTRSGDLYTLPFSCQGNFREAACWRREW